MWTISFDEKIQPILKNENFNKFGGLIFEICQMENVSVALEVPISVYYKKRYDTIASIFYRSQ